MAAIITAQASEPGSQLDKWQWPRDDQTPSPSFDLAELLRTKQQLDHFRFPDKPVEAKKLSFQEGYLSDEEDLSPIDNSDDAISFDSYDYSSSDHISTPATDTSGFGDTATVVVIKAFHPKPKMIQVAHSPKPSQSGPTLARGQAPPPMAVQDRRRSLDLSLQSHVPPRRQMRNKLSKRSSIGTAPPSFESQRPPALVEEPRPATPSFLNSDPYAHPVRAMPATPSTPTTPTRSGAKRFHRLSKSISRQFGKRALSHADVANPGMIAAAAAPTIGWLPSSSAVVAAEPPTPSRWRPMVARGANEREPTLELPPFAPADFGVGLGFDDVAPADPPSPVAPKRRSLRRRQSFGLLASNGLPASGR